MPVVLRRLQRRIGESIRRKGDDAEAESGVMLVHWETLGNVWIFKCIFSARLYSPSSWKDTFEENVGPHARGLQVQAVKGALVRDNGHN